MLPENHQLHVKPSEWLRRSRTLLYDAYWPPFHPHLEYDAVRGVAIARELGANAIRFGTCGKWALFPSRVMPAHPELAERDLLRETISHAHAEQIKVIAYVPVGHGLPGVLVHKQRPQWAFILDDGTSPPPQRHFGEPALVPVCPFGPYRSDILAVVREVVDNYEVDGLYIDGPYYGWIFEGICQCSSCRAGFRATTGLALPSNAELIDPRGTGVADRLRRHRSWVSRGMLSLITDIREIARCRGLPLIFNGCVAEYLAGKWQHEAIRAADGFLLESHRGGVKGVGRGIQLGKIVWNYTHQHNCWNRRSTREVEEENALAGRLAIAQGASPIVSYAGRFFTSTSNAGPVRRLFAEMIATEAAAWGSEAVPFAALIASADLQPTGGWLKDSRPGHDGHLYAMGDMLRDVGVQHVVLPSAALEDAALLRAYAVVVLAGVRDLSAAAISNLHAYIAAGGGLVVTGETPVTAGGGFVLGDLLGAEPATADAELSAVIAAHRWDQVDAPWDVYLAASEDAPVELPRQALAQGEFRLVRPKAGCEVLANIVIGSSWKPIAPGLLRYRNGLGCTVFAPSAIEMTWASPGISGRDRSLSGLAAVACDLAAGWSRPYLLDAPRGVFSNMMAGSDNALLYLVDEVAERDHVHCAVHLLLPGGRLPSSITNLLDGQTIPFVLNGGRAVIADFTWSRHACLEMRP